MKYNLQFKVLTLIALLFVGCSKSEETSSVINQSEVKLKFDQEFVFTVSNAASVQWTSSDPFVGTIDNSGKFTAEHIGETTITANFGGRSTMAKVIVEPYVAGITEPLYGQAISKGDVKAFETRSLTWETSTSLAYAGGSPKESDLMYLWQDRGVWNGSYITFNTTFSEADADTFYSERYIKVSMTSSESNYKTQDNKTIIRLRINKSNGHDAYYHVN